MKWLKDLLAKIASYFTSGRAARDAQLACEYAAKVLPIISIAADIVVRLTPTGVDDAVWAALKVKFPELFSGKQLSGDELKLYALGVATELVKSKFPELDTSVARTAIQLAYLEFRQTQPPVVAAA